MFLSLMPVVLPSGVLRLRTCLLQTFLKKLVQNHGGVTQPKCFVQMTLSVRE